MGVVRGIVVGHARLAGVHIGAAKILCRDHLPRRRLYQRRAAQEDRALLAHNHRLVRHGRHIGTTRRTRAHDSGDLGNALRAHLGLVVEDPSEMFPVRKDFRLVGQVCTARVDKVNARQMVFERDLLGPQMLLHRDGEVGAALHRRVVADNQAFPAFNPADAGDNSGGRRLVAIHAMGGQRADLQKGTARVQQALDPVPRKQLAPVHMALAGAFRPAKRGFGRVRPQIFKQAFHGGLVRGKARPRHVETGFQDGHSASLQKFQAGLAVCGAGVTRVSPDFTRLTEKPSRKGRRRCACSGT